MTWQLKWGPHVKAFEEQSRKAGKPIGPLVGRPKLLKIDLPYYNAFQTCSASRPAGVGGTGAIPISEVVAFCQLVGIASAEERFKYLGLIQELDTLCLAHWAKETSKAHE